MKTAAAQSPHQYLILSRHGKTHGVDHQSGALFRSARRSGLWPTTQAIHRTALVKARQKVPWEVFQEPMGDAIEVAYDIWPDGSQSTWKGMSVYAIDGSKYSLPATEYLFRNNSIKLVFWGMSTLWP